MNKDQTSNLDRMNTVLEIGGRLNSAPSQLMVNTAFDDELKHQLNLMRALDMVDLSHTVSAIELEVIPKHSGRELLQALQRLCNEPEDFKPDPAYGDLYTNREAWLYKNTEATAWLGAGRARREAITTAFFIKIREQLLGLNNILLILLDTLLLRAECYARAIMPDYTYLQSAQPTTFGHFLLTPAYGIIRDIERLQAVFRKVNQSPAGCGSSTGSKIPQNRLRLAELMGFENIIKHCRDAMWPADIPIEVSSVTTNVLINLNRLAEDLMVFNSQEFGLIELSDRHCRASKIMPNKKNPFALNYFRGLSNETMGHLVTVTTMARTPSGQPDNRLTIYGLLPESLLKTTQAVELFNEVINDLKFNQQRGLERATQSLIGATDLAETLVLNCGMEFRNAHRLVAALIREQGSDPSRFHNMDINDISQMARQLGFSIPELSKTALTQALDPELSILCKTEPGGCSPDALIEMITGCRKTMTEYNAWSLEQSARHQKARRNLEQTISKVLDE